MESREDLFDAKTTEMLHTKYGRLPAWARPTIALAATDPSQADHRRWLTDQVDRLQPQQRAEFLSRLRTSEQYVQTTVELAVGSLFVSAGMDVGYNPVLESLTPDLAITDQAGTETIAEVWTRSRPAGMQAALDGWGHLANAVNRIAVPATLSVDGGDADSPRTLTQKEITLIASALRRWLLSPMTSRGILSVAGYIFTIQGQATGMRASLLPPTFASHADSRLVWDAVHKKASKYRKAIVRRGTPFVVVLSAEPGAGLDKSQVKSALSGKNTLTMNFSFYTVGAVASRPVELRHSEAPPRFDPCLSAVGWVDEPLSHDRHLTLWPVPGAHIPISGPSSERLTI